MRQINYLVIAVTCVAAALPLIYGQIQPRNTVPETITLCYMNNTAYNRFTRQPMHISNLIAIIRKLEVKLDGQWDIRRIARTLIHRYMFDGMEFNPSSKEDFQYRQKPEERAKSLMVKQIIPIPQEEVFPDFILDNDEKCALHWMLSHSMNATVRDEELAPSYGYNPPNPGYNPNNPGSNPLNPGYNNNNGNYNPNTNNNQNPSMGNNYYNRGKRSADGDYEDDSMGWSSEENKDSVEGAAENTQNATKEEESVKADIDLSNEEVVDDAKEDQPADSKSESNLPETNDNDLLSAENESNEGTKLSLPQDSDVDFLPGALGRSAGSSKSARQVSPNIPQMTRRPIETGVVYTKWGSISAGRLIAGIAAGLEPVQMTVNSGVNYVPDPSYGGSNPWSGGSGTGVGNSWGQNSGGNGYGYGAPGKSVQPNSNQYPNAYGSQSQYPNGRRKKRQVSNLDPIQNLHAATLAGDVGQAAILNAIHRISANTPPRGVFNDTICPREYVLEQHPDSTKEIFQDDAAWSYLTEAEIRGGLDGMILGNNIRRWDPSYTLRLSDLLEMYYSEDGIAGETNFRACDRSSLLSQNADTNQILQQARSFAYVYNNRTNELSDQTLISRPNVFDSLVSEAHQRMMGVATSFSSIDPPCTRRQGGGGQESDDQKFITPKLTVYGVLDHTATIYEIDQQKRFLGQLAHDINVSPQGSRLGVVDGNSGTVLISPNWTDTSPILACGVLGLYSQTKSQDYARVLTNLKSELEKVQNDEIRYNFTTDNSVVILLMVQGKRLEQNQRDDIIRLRNEIQQQFGDVNVIAASNRYTESDFDGIQFMRISPGQNMSDYTADFAQQLSKNTQGSLKYLQCNADRYNQDNEHQIPTHLYFTPGELRYYKIAPSYFYSSRNLMLRFTSLNGKVRICQTRQRGDPNSSNDGSDGVTCKETSGNYIEVGRPDVDVEFSYKQPCGKHGKRDDCQPIFISITPTSFQNPGQVGMDCSQEGCQSSNQVKVTFTHWDMRCNGAVRTLLSSTVAIIASAFALLNWLKAT